jgi:2-polyprenyl-3-methyl-5-hydroxy-6-metoxy-1,4-benzoquinol methylase
MILREAFDTHIDDFRHALEETMQGATRPFLGSTMGMIASLRYLDRFYTDICEFSRDLAPGSRILDLGTGCGIAAFMLAGLGHSVEAIDVDDFREVPSIHDQMGNEQRLLWKALTSRQPAVRFQHYHNSKIPFADASFDAVMAYGVIEHIPEEVLRPVMREVARVTKPGGCLLVSYLPRTWALLELVLIATGQPHHTRRWGDKEIHRFLDDLNFETIVSKRIIFAPQYPSSFTNRHKAVLDKLDALAGIPPFSFFARDLLLIARKAQTRS